MKGRRKERMMEKGEKEGDKTYHKMKNARNCF